MAPPQFSLYDHQSALSLDLTYLTGLATAAWSHVIAQPGPQDAVLPDLQEVEISFITDEAIAKVHAEFLDDPAPTDVITFGHGEILISTETAVRQAPDHGHSSAAETMLYLIHGLLHLNGHEDETAEGFATMKSIQQSILEQVWLENH